MSLEARVKALEARVDSLEGKRSARRVLPILVSAEGVCGVDPERKSTTCPDASLYRRRKGCLGVACQQAAAEYYEQYRSVAPPKRRR